MSAWSQRGQRWCEWDGDARCRRCWPSSGRSRSPAAGPRPIGPAPVRCRPRRPNPPASSTPTPSPSPTSQPTKKPSSTKPSKPAPLLERGDKGRKVRELQHRLHQLDWFSGSITGVYGKRTVRGVKGFQAKRKITKTGEVDRATWAALVKRTRKPTNAELHNQTRRRSRDHEAGLER